MGIELQQLVARLEANMGQVVLGKADVIRMCVVALLAGEHVLARRAPCWRP
jgi:MoxR-like ATPase